jgi:hypothetical protein
VRLLVLFLALIVLPALAQEKKAKSAPKKMPVAKGHSKPSPEQIRRFNELEKKQAK